MNSVRTKTFLEANGFPEESADLVAHAAWSAGEATTIQDGLVWLVVYKDGDFTVGVR